MLSKTCTALLLAAAQASCLAVQRQTSSDRKVFAHYMVGLTDGQSSAQWAQDISDAQSAGIDGFALNIGGSDSWNDAQLPLAYAAAAAAGDFVLFLSFDQSTATSFSVDQVTGLVNDYKGESAQFKINDLPFVSTFEGPDWSSNWADVRTATGGIYLVPDWSSLGPTGFGDKLSLIDGACKCIQPFHDSEATHGRIHLLTLPSSHSQLGRLALCELKDSSRGRRHGIPINTG